MYTPHYFHIIYLIYFVRFLHSPNFYTQDLHRHTYLWADATGYVVIAMLFSGAKKGLRQARGCIHDITNAALEAK